MEALQNRAVAVLLCVIMILAACVLGTGGGLAQLREQTEGYFYTGTSKRETGLNAELNTLAGECYNMTVIAARYLPEDQTEITAIRQKRVELSAAATPGEKRLVMEEMVSATGLLWGELQAVDLSAQDKDLLAKCDSNMEQTMDLITHNGYNGAAAYYNSTLKRFPANLLGPLTGARPMELYE